MNAKVISHEALIDALSLRDLTDPLQGQHAMQEIVDLIRTALSKRYGCLTQVHRGLPLVSVEDNYDNLGYPEDGAARDARYTRYVSGRLLLRTQTSAMIPGLLRAIAPNPPEDLLLVIPGVVYRRDVVDRLHTGEPHQLDLTRVRRGRLTSRDLSEMVEVVVETVLPGYRYAVTPARHPYTTEGLQIDVEVNGETIEIGECGVAAKAILKKAGLNGEEISGLMMGLGLDRILMIRKGIDDIRLLRSADPRIAKQMADLNPYVPVSKQPPVRRDLSIAVASDLTPEELGDRIRETMSDRLGQLESVEVVSEAAYEKLPLAAHQRMGMRPDQKNVLLRLVIRDHTRTLRSNEANEIRDAVYRTIHEGERMELAAA